MRLIKKYEKNIKSDKINHQKDQEIKLNEGYKMS